MDYSIDNYRDMAIEFRTTALNLLSNINRKEKLVAESDLPNECKNVLRKEISAYLKAYNALIDLESSMFDKIAEMEKKKNELKICP